MLLKGAVKRFEVSPSHFEKSQLLKYSSPSSKILAYKKYYMNCYKKVRFRGEKTKQHEYIKETKGLPIAERTGLLNSNKLLITK